MRLGYSTGACAASAAKAACYMLLSGRKKTNVMIDTPKGIALNLRVLDIEMGEYAVSCAIKKDAGDAPDITHGALIYARVSYSNELGVHIDGGEGVGRVTIPGLDQNVGEAAINSVSRQTIKENVEEVMALFDCKSGMNVLIYVPDGAAIARKTFTPRLGVIGGISVLGTTGIVEPTSEAELVETIKKELEQRRAIGHESVLLMPNKCGVEFIKDEFELDPETAVLTSSFIGDSVDFCRELGFKRVLLIGHIETLVKLAGNMLNTHSKYGDCRMELICAHAAACGASTELIMRMMGCAACDEAVRMLRETDPVLETAVLNSLAKKSLKHLSYRAGDGMGVSLVVFSNEYGILWKTEGVDEFLNLTIS